MKTTTTTRGEVYTAQRPGSQFLNPAQIAAIRFSFPTLHDRMGLAQELFARRLFELDPGLRLLFTNHLGNPGWVFKAAVLHAMRHLDTLPTLLESADKFGRLHRSDGIRDRDYARVGAAFLWTIDYILGPKVTQETRSAWKDLFILVVGTAKLAAETVATPSARVELSLA